MERRKIKFAGHNNLFTNETGIETRITERKFLVDPTSFGNKYRQAIQITT